MKNEEINVTIKDIGIRNNFYEFGTKYFYGTDGIGFKPHIGCLISVIWCVFAGRTVMAVVYTLSHFY